MKIKPKVGDLVKVTDPHFDDNIDYAYCTESKEKFFTLRYFEDMTKQHDYEYWTSEKYDLVMSIISGS
jgi:hypothetical protein